MFAVHWLCFAKMVVMFPAPHHSLGALPLHWRLFVPTVRPPSKLDGSYDSLDCHSMADVTCVISEFGHKNTLCFHLAVRRLTPGASPPYCNEAQAAHEEAHVDRNQSPWPIAYLSSQPTAAPTCQPSGTLIQPQPLVELPQQHCMEQRWAVPLSPV